MGSRHWVQPFGWWAAGIGYNVLVGGQQALGKTFWLMGSRHWVQPFQLVIPRL